MSSTYTWDQALTVAKLYVKSIPTSTIDATVCDQLNSYIWKAYPWRWAQASLTSGSGVLSLVDGQQDYGMGTLSGGGFYQLLRVRITRTDTTPNIVREKDIVQWLPPNIETEGGIDTIKAIAIEPVNSYLRLDSAASVASGTTYRIDGEYWMQPVKVTATTSVIVFPDQYFDTVIEGLKWKYYQLGDDSRANDQLAIFQAAMKKMIDDEDYGEGSQFLFPGDVIGAGKAGNPGLFGFY